MFASGFNFNHLAGGSFTWLVGWSVGWLVSWFLPKGQEVGVKLEWHLKINVNNYANAWAMSAQMRLASNRFSPIYTLLTFSYQHCNSNFYD